MSTVVNHRNMETLTSTTSPAMTTTATEAAAATNVSRSWNATDQKLWDMIDNDYKTMLSTPQQPYVAAFVAAYSAILSLSLLGNLMVIIVIRTSKSMRNVTNYFLFNLAVADLLGGLVGGAWVPGWLGGRGVMRVGGWMGGWVAGWTGCHARGWMDGWMGGWVDGVSCAWVDGWVDGRVDGWVAWNRE